MEHRRWDTTSKSYRVVQLKRSDSYIFFESSADADCFRKSEWFMNEMELLHSTHARKIKRCDQVTETFLSPKRVSHELVFSKQKEKQVRYNLHNIIES